MLKVLGNTFCDMTYSRAIENTTVGNTVRTCYILLERQFFTVNILL